MRRLTVLLVGAAMAALVLTVAGLAWAADCGRGCENPPPDTTTPTIISTNPADGATGVDRDANIKAKFSEKMLADSVMMPRSVPSVGAFRLYRGNLTAAQIEPTCDTGPCAIPIPLEASVSYNNRKKRATLNPANKLDAGTTYTAIIEGAGDSDGLAVKDKAGNEMASDYIWHFTTGAN